MAKSATDAIVYTGFHGLCGLVFLTDRIDFVPFSEVGACHLKAEWYVILDTFEHQAEDPREVADPCGWTVFSAAGDDFDLAWLEVL